MERCKTCGAPVDLAPDGDPCYVGDPSCDPGYDFRQAVKALLDNVEAVARDSFAHSAETFEADFEREDPEGHKAWANVRAALAHARAALGEPQEGGGG